MFTTKTTLIIPTKDRSGKLIRLLKNIFQLKKKFNEIIVIDSSKEKHKKKLINFIKNRKIKLFHSLPSTTIQRNIGLKKRRKDSKFILFFDDDIIINKKSIEEMNTAIKRYNSNNHICSFGFNLETDTKNFKFEKFKQSKFLKYLNLYDSAPGKVLESGWHTKISNLKKDTYVDWIYTGATIYKSNVIKNKKFKDLNRGFNYLEDLHFSYYFTKKKMKHLVIAKAKVLNSNIVSRNSFEFGFIEILNRYKFVDKFLLNKNKFYFSAFARSIFLIINLLDFKFNSIFRFFGNVKGILYCLFININKIK